MAGEIAEQIQPDPEIVQRYGQAGRWFHAGVYATALVPLATGWWFVVARYHTGSPLARLTGMPDEAIHELAGYASVCVLLVWWQRPWPTPREHDHNADTGRPDAQRAGNAAPPCRSGQPACHPPIDDVRADSGAARSHRRGCRCTAGLSRRTAFNACRRAATGRGGTTNLARLARREAPRTLRPEPILTTERLYAAHGGQHAADQ